LLTGRAVLLGTLVLLLALTLAGPMRQYVAGRQELAELAAEGTALDQRVADLQEQLKRQADPAYTAQQALSRLAYVLPGDRLVVVADGRASAGDPGTISEPAPTEQLPWYDGLLASVAGADGDTPAQEPAG
jgi:cell division protein FtsB